MRKTRPWKKTSLNYEEKKAKILEEAKEVDTEDFLASKGISRDED